MTLDQLKFIGKYEKSKNYESMPKTELENELSKWEATTKVLFKGIGEFERKEMNKIKSITKNTVKW